MNQDFMKYAIKMAIENVKAGKGGPFAAIVVKDGAIIGEGTNGVTTHNDPTAHAEVVAIRNACKLLNDFQLTDCEIYTTCEPCPMCLGAIYWARPKAIYYAATRYDATDINFDDSFIYEEINAEIPNRKIKTTQILRDEALEIFKTWTEKTDKVEY